MTSPGSEARSASKQKTRRPKGSGGIRNRGTDRHPRWFAYYSATVRGESHQVSRGPFDRKADAEAWLTDQLRLKKERGGRAPIPGRTTVGELLDQWLKARRRALSPNSFEQYQRTVQQRLEPELGDLRLTELQPEDIVDLLEKLRAPGADLRGRKIDMHGNRTRPSAKGLSETSLQHVLGTLQTALRWAAKKGKIAYNPADDVDRPKRERTEMEIWTAAELARFLQFVEDVSGDRLLPLYRLAAYTGARRSELLGLRWPDVDLEAGTIRIQRARIRAGAEMLDSDPKTDKSRRTVDLDPGTVAALRRWAKAQKAERLAAGPGWTDSGYVFTEPDGRPFQASHLARRFGAQARAASVPVIRFHDLRHTHASLLLAKGVPVLDVSRRIGHANASMTLDVYGHVVEGHGERTAAAFAALMDSNGGT